MNIDDLKIEIDTDSLARGYSGMDDQQVADSLNNTIDRNVNKTNITGSEIWEQVDSGELAALSTDQRQEVFGLCGIDGGVDPFGAASQIIINIFGAPGASNTTDNLQGFRVETVSRAVEIKLGRVEVGHVQLARR